ncbi:uncharacterized protein Dwil_GK17478 [Drosophila willistoni]|uniref:Uncharacterized protein n=1 Tax=Drosophila willistoni TaxID=7260 RepID=B4NP86_DROWI|nr:uncharacterized protein LOC6652941 [Drosophila willistoni]EDW86326.1 uncharacterized protein Dwil_GK17478 [Drosophila willistoni]
MQRDDPEHEVGGGGRGGRHQMETSIQEMERNLQEMPPAPRRESLSSYTNWSQQSFFNSFVNENLAISNNSSNVDNENMDIGDVHDQLRASKFLNLMLMRLWRRRRAEVYGLHTLAHKYKEHTERLQEELSIRDRIISSERRRSDQLATQLNNTLDRFRLTWQSCHQIDKGSRHSNNREDKLRGQLMAKSQECENFEELLEACKKDLFRELAKFRNCSRLLANEQRRALQLELLNNELGNELLALREVLLVQNNLMVVSICVKQEQLNTAYETLKICEHELALLEIKYSQLREYDIQMEQRNNDAAKNMRFIQNVLFVQATRQSNPLYSCLYHISACVFDYFMPSYSTAARLDHTVRIFLALAFLLASFL